MIDWNAPIELDNGTRAEVVNTRRYAQQGGRNIVSVRVFGAFGPREREPSPEGRCWNYFEDTGKWCGGSGREYKIVNSNRPEDNIPEEW